MRLAWLTDVHLNFIDDVARQEFYQEIVSSQCDGVLISGDIAEAPCVVDMYKFRLHLTVTHFVAMDLLSV